LKPSPICDSCGAAIGREDDIGVDFIFTGIPAVDPADQAAHDDGLLWAEGAAKDATAAIEAAKTSDGEDAEDELAQANAALDEATRAKDALVPPAPKVTAISLALDPTKRDPLAAHPTNDSISYDLCDTCKTKLFELVAEGLTGFGIAKK
jgi:hypothetical protein